MNKITIGIVTFHKAYSYGAAMQCYALQKVLKSDGFDVHIIDYSMTAYMEHRKGKRFLYFIKSGKRFLREPVRLLKIYIHNIKKYKLQKAFRKQLTIRNQKFRDFWNTEYTTNGITYETCSQIKREPPRYDVYICGSDQIWNPKFCDMDDNYYLAFAPVEKRIAYAPSLGTTKLEPGTFRVLRTRIAEIPYLSFREDTMRDALKMPEVPIVMDPTFLLQTGDWKRLGDRSEIKVPEKYIFAYFIGNDNYVRNYIRELERNYSAKYQIIHAIFDYCEYGPYDFVKLIRDARYVVTNSFHGMALAIKMNVPFCIGRTQKDLAKNSGFTRMESLLKQLRLHERILDMKHPDYRHLEDAIDFQAVNRRIQETSEASHGFLVNAIELAAEE